MTTNRIAVLGCGPAGLLAVHAAATQGLGVDVYSVKKKSPHGGAQYLHRAIPELTDLDADFSLRYVKLGNREGYARKVYGNPDAPVSWDKFWEGDVEAWSMGDAYDNLWEMYSHLIRDIQLDCHRAARLALEYPVIVNTIPAKAICLKPDEHTFEEQRIALSTVGQMDARNVIVYNGQETEPWYRTSNINGVAWTEYSTTTAVGFIEDPPKHLDYGFKPVRTNCDCHPTIRRMGRFGKWQKQVLSHEAFFDMESLLESLSS